MELGVGNLPEKDLLVLSEHIYSLKDFYDGRKVIIYGGTGFVGTWLSAGLLKAKLDFNLDIEIKIITRNRKQAEKKFGSSSNQITFVQHDFSAGPLFSNDIGDIVIHAATPTNPTTGSLNLVNTLNGTINAALHARDIRGSGSENPYVLHLSSGSIYGFQPLGMRNRLESDPSLLIADDVYTQAKISAEQILLDTYKAGRINLQSPRLFAFAGPLISLTHHYAVGNFLQNGMSDEKIKVQGSPLTMRSYIYPLDLARIIFSLVTLKKYCEINIGSDLPISMIELASKISDFTSKRGVDLINPHANPSNYVPSIKNLRSLVWQQDFITLDQALEKWVTWIESVNRSAREA